ncbi:uncharacterized protein LOC106521613 [Austrofundulus limnaeus]|uniref:Uncharacterized protein LOC106521613 n=1 Tax=Austrofundulus limnaeus TaxID=52670 RepID=A0A2I4BPS1_AUSLI|nr:PREDICTED: uncharacterized protein LOC106521613 [Austrofundulus limnaeus]
MAPQKNMKEICIVTFWPNPQKDNLFTLFKRKRTKSPEEGLLSDPGTSRVNQADRLTSSSQGEPVWRTKLQRRPSTADFNLLVPTRLLVNKALHSLRHVPPAAPRRLAEVHRSILRLSVCLLPAASPAASAAAATPASNRGSPFVRAAGEERHRVEGCGQIRGSRTQPQRLGWHRIQTAAEDCTEARLGLRSGAEARMKENRKHPDWLKARRFFPAIPVRE